MTQEGGEQDRQGTDAYAFGLFERDRVQIKFDRRIASSGNVYHEVYEKTKGRPDQHWRPSPHRAGWYIFTTLGHAWLVPVDVLAQIEVGRELVQISDTSIGFLVDEQMLEWFGCERQEHSL